jgi:hypothetical protein
MSENEEIKSVISQCYQGCITYDEAIDKVGSILNTGKIQIILQKFIDYANEIGL